MYIKIKDYIFIFDDDTCVEQKNNRREFAHTEELSEDGRGSEQLYIHIYICMQNHNDDTIKTRDTVL